MKYETLITAISDAHANAQSGAATAINHHLIFRNWLIGAFLVEFAQHGVDRAKYGAGLLESISRNLRQRGIPGVSPDLLERMRSFFLAYLQIEFASPQPRQPFAIGKYAHFGLGLFIPVPANNAPAEP